MRCNRIDRVLCLPVSWFHSRRQDHTHPRSGWSRKPINHRILRFAKRAEAARLAMFTWRASLTELFVSAQAASHARHAFSILFSASPACPGGRRLHFEAIRTTSRPGIRQERRRSQENTPRASSCLLSSSNCSLLPTWNRRVPSSFASKPTRHNARLVMKSCSGP